MKKFFLLIGIILLGAVFEVKALTASVECPDDNFKINETFSCQIGISTEEGEILTLFRTNINYSSKDLDLVSITPANNWVSSSNTAIDLSYNGEETSFEKNIIATLNFKVKDTTEYGTKTINISGEDLVSSVGDTIKIISDNNYLKSLTVDGRNFTFNKTQNKYSLGSVTSSYIDINATLDDSRAKFDSNYAPGRKTLSYGLNTIQIIVISESGKSNIYTLEVTRTDTRSKNNNLASLEVSTGVMTPSFSAITLVYDVSVPTNTESITINATLANSKAYFVDGYGPRLVKLKDGINSILIQVKAENGTAKTYTINVTRSDKDSNNYLKDIKLSSGTIEFAKDVTSYNMSVLYEVEEMEIVAEAENDLSKVEVIGNKNLQVGENVYSIKVTAENESIRTYTLTVTRLEQGEILSDNNYLKSIVIKDYELLFDKNVLKYNLTIKQEDEVTLSYEAEDSNANVRVIGNQNLETGSIISLIVTAENGEMRTYEISIKKSIPWGTIAIIGGSIILLIGITLLIIFRDKIFKRKEVAVDSDVLKNSKLILKDDSVNLDKTKIYKKKPTLTVIPDIPEEEIEEPELYQGNINEKKK